MKAKERARQLVRGRVSSSKVRARLAARLAASPAPMARLEAHPAPHARLAALLAASPAPRPVTQSPARLLSMLRSRVGGTRAH